MYWFLRLLGFHIHTYDKWRIFYDRDNAIWQRRTCSECGYEEARCL